jgi:hypothetical protein
MPRTTQSTLIGDILVRRGIITPLQLREAIEIQQARHLLDEKQGNFRAPTPIGEILIELSFINRKQLRQSLGWQSRLRKATLVMSFVAPILTTACGGGGGGGPSTNPAGNNKSEQSSISSLVMSSQSSSSDGFVSGPVLLSWTLPSQRENGEPLQVEEISGYELRYKQNQEEEFTTVKIEGGYVNSYYFNHLEGKVEFEIAAYDTNGLYSRFMPIRPQPK